MAVGCNRRLADSNLLGDEELERCSLKRNRLSNPMAGLDPAIHVFFLRHSLSNKDVDPRDKPGGGEFFDARM